MRENNKISYIPGNAEENQISYIPGDAKEEKQISYNGYGWMPFADNCIYCYPVQEEELFEQRTEKCSRSGGCKSTI